MMKYPNELEKLELFARALSLQMTAKLQEKYRKGFRGWDSKKPAWRKGCTRLMLEHIGRALEKDTKEDWVDVANFVMFKWTKAKKR